jgi:PAS domain S-box-containing protein
MNGKKTRKAQKHQKKINAAKKYDNPINIDIPQNSDHFFEILKEKEKEILQAEDALVEALKRFRDIYEQSPIGISIHDTSGNILVVNAAFQSILGVRSFSDISSYNFFRDKHFSSVNIEDMKSGRVIQVEIDINREEVSFATEKEGIMWLFITGSPISRGNKVIGYMLMLQDITERKKIEESQRLAQLGRLISDMAHEVNNPLMVIAGRAELALTRGIRDERLKETFQIIIDQSFFAKDIIQRVLKYSRLGKVKKDSIDIIATFDMILKLLSHYLVARNVKVKKTVKGVIPYVFGNEKQLQEVFINILKNSADAMPRGGNICVNINKTKKYVNIKIKDDGEGMPRKVLEKIFEPFYTTKDNGTGLGLAVCHTLIQEHEGELKFDSKKGKGTTATISLPYITAKDK